MSSHPVLGLPQVALAGVLWGTGGLAVEVVRAGTSMSVLTISAWRMVIGALALLLLLAVAGRATRWRAPGLRGVVALARARPGQVVAVGVATAAYQALYFAAVVLVGVSVATVVSLGIAPVLVTAVEAVRARSRPGPRRLVTLVAALAGLLLVAGASGHAGSGPHPVLGVVTALGSGAAYALTSLLGRGLTVTEPPLTLTAATTSAGALALLPLGLVGSAGGPVLLPSDAVTWATLLHLGVLTMALAYVLFYAGLRHTTGSAATVATLLEPVTAAAVAAAFLGERIGLQGAVGAGLIVAAVAGSAGRRRRFDPISPRASAPARPARWPPRRHGRSRRPRGG